MKLFERYNNLEMISEHYDVTVYKATSAALKEPVILKVLDLLHTSKSQKSKFEEEYAIASHTGLTHTPKVLEFYEDESMAAIVFEYIHGDTLKDVIKTYALDLKQKVDLSLLVCNALLELHSLDIVHKDISPNNIIVERKLSWVKLIDYGLSIDLQPSEGKQKQSSFLELSQGTMNYIAPEMTGRVDKPIDFRSDIYALGMVLYELFSGVTPFKEEDYNELLYKQIAVIPQNIQELNRHIPTPLARMIMKCIEKDPDDRYQTLFGLREDFLRIQEGLEAGDVVAFEIAQDDIDRLFKKELVGRSADIAVVDAMVSRVIEKSAFETLFISGVSGIGKSALIEFFKPKIYEKQAMMLEVKADQYQKNTPFFVWVRLLKICYDLMISETSKRREQMVETLVQELDGYLEVFITLAPEFGTLFETKVLGQKKNSEHQPEHIYKALLLFIQSFASFYKALFICIDDLQWIDQASVELMEELFEEAALKRIGFFIAYRDDEVKEKAFLEAFLHRVIDIKKMPHLALKKLTKKDITQFVKDHLKHHYAHLEALVELIFRRSGGNPFYMQWFYIQLIDKKFIFFNNEAKLWQWDIATIEEAMPSLDTLELISQEITKLPSLMKHLFGYAAMIGNRLDRELLLAICHKVESEEGLDKLLQQGVGLGFLKLKQEAYYFAHDRFQERFYEQMEPLMVDELKRRTLDYLVEKELIYDERYLFLALDFISDIKETLEDLHDHELFISLSLEAVKVAKQSASYETIRAILKACESSLAFLELREHAYDYALKFKHRLEQAQNEYLLGDYDKARTLIEELDSFVMHDEDKIELFALKKRLLATQNELIGTVCNEGLILGSHLGIALEDYEEHEAVFALHAKLQEKIASLESLLSLAYMKDKHALMKMRFLMDFWEVAYYDENEPLMRFSVLNMIALSLEYGNSLESAFAYVLYAAQLADEKRFDLAYRVGNSGVKLNHHFHDGEQLPKVHNLFCNYVNPLYKPWDSNIALYEKSIEQSIKNGDKVFGIWAAYLQKWSYLFSSITLENLRRLIQEHQAFVFSAQDEKMHDAYVNFDTFVSRLQSSEGLKNGHYIEEQHFKPAQTWNSLLQSIEHIVLGDYERACEMLFEPNLLDNINLVMFPALFITWFRPLAALLSRPCHSDEIEHIAKQLPELKALSDQNPENFLVFYLLIKAEFLKCQSDYDHWEVVALYKLAINYAYTFSQTLLKGLCCELFAKYWQQRSEQKERKYLKKAYRAYKSWGSLSKCDQMVGAYGTWVSLSEKEGKHHTHQGFSHRTTREGDFDTQTLLQATEVISAELDTDKLMRLLSEIMLKHSGAQELSLFEYHQEAWSLIESFALMPQYRRTKACQPEKILNYLFFEQQNLIIDDLEEAFSFSRERCFEKLKPKSILAIPLFDKAGKVVMALVAQNFLLTSAFSAEHEKALLYVMRQAWISLKNAKLVAELEAELHIHKALDEKIKLLGEIVQESPLMVMVSDSEGVIKYVNDAFMRVTGFSEAEILGQKPSILKSGKQATYFYKDLWETVKKGEIWKGELINKRKDGSIYYEYQTIAPLFDTQGLITHFVAFKEDINDRKEKEKLYFMQSRQAQMGEMLSMIAHQWRQPLSSINSIVINNRFKEGLGTLKSEDIIESYEKIETLVSHLSETIDDFRNFFKPNKTAVNVNINELIHKTEALLHGLLIDKNVHLELDLHACDPIETFDREVIQVLINIIKNSIDHLILNHIEEKHIWIKSFQKEQKIYIHILDNAGGIAKEHLNDIFLPYFSTKSEKQGTGLGLYMSKTIIEDHCHGHLSARNYEKGALFEIVLHKKEA